jgi:hypothetical protein
MKATRKNSVLALIVGMVVLGMASQALAEPVFHYTNMERYPYYEGNVNNGGYDENWDEFNGSTGPWTVDIAGGPSYQDYYINVTAGMNSDIGTDVISYNGYASMDWDVGPYEWSWPATFAGDASRMYIKFTVDEPLTLELTYDVGTETPTADDCQVYSGVRMRDLDNAFDVFSYSVGAGSGTVYVDVVPGTTYWYRAANDLALGTDDDPASGYWADSVSATLSIVPEPSGLALMLVGGLALLRRR